ncbi:MAG: GLPGLI family protein [Muribaculaceae bacterium]|nr:GLPGLI family protein [Muribaculaceae bacterium]
MNRYIFLLLSIVVCQVTLSAKIKETEIIDSALIKVVYRRTMVTDTLRPREKFKEDIITLFAGKRGSAFYSEERRVHEEAMQNEEYLLKLLQDENAFGSKAELEETAIFRNNANNTTIENLRYDLTAWQLKEVTEYPKWNVTDSVQNVLGYECLMATTDFRGRTWIAFFSPEIAIAEGPWKLCGLPGIILKAADDKGHYTFEAISLQTENIGKVEYFNFADRYPIRDRRKALLHRNKALNENVINKIKASTGIDTDAMPPTLKTKNNYDFEETDYHHK